MKVTSITMDEESGVTGMLLPNSSTDSSCTPSVVSASSQLIASSCQDAESNFDESDPSIESTTITSSPEPSLRSSRNLDKRRPKSSLWCLFSFGIFSFILGVLAIIFPPFDVLMNERLRMLKGFPAFEWWKNPPDEVLLRLYVFNITNKDAFLAGREKLHLEEIGPWIFREKLKHTDIYFNPNDTMTYTAHRTAEFLPELSNGLDMETPLVVANFGLLGMASFLWDASFLTKLGLNMMMMQYNSQAILEMKAGDYMWNNSDPLFQLAGKFLPSLAPTTNLGIMQVIYEHFSDEVTVYMGLNSSRRFFAIDKWKGRSRLGYWDDEVCDRAVGASEGVAYPQFLTREDHIVYLRKTFCRASPLYFLKDQEKYGMKGYYYQLPNDTFASGDEKPSHKCFRRKDDHSPPLPSGTTDVSPCFYNFPIASSFPHFMYGSPELTEKIEGLNPDPEKHGSYVLVEPTTGVPMESKARSQSNLIIRPLHGLSPRVMPFSNMSIPMFWAEYNQVGLPWYISGLMYFATKIVPPMQQPFAFVLVTGGMSMLLAALFGWTCYRANYLPESPANSTPNTRSYSSLNMIAASVVSTKSGSLSRITR